jgi:hypothetical protein
MNEKETLNIVVAVAQSQGWGGPISQVLARFASEEDLKGLKSSSFKKVDSELGKVYFDKRVYAYGEDVKFNLSKFFWSTTLFVDGVGVEGGPGGSCR